MNITLVNIAATTTCPERDGIDADVVVDGVKVGEVTLLRDHNDEITTWGEIDHWASDGVRAWLAGLDADERRDAIGEIVGAAN